MRQRSMIFAVAALACAGPAHAQYYAQPQPHYYAPPAQGRAAPRAQMQAVTPQMVVVAQPQRMERDLGGGFIEAIFGGGGSDRTQGYAPLPHQRQYQHYQQPQYAAPQGYYGPPGPVQQVYASTGPIVGEPVHPRNYPINPIYEKQEVAFTGSEEPGTIVIDTPNKFLYLVQPGGRALRYGIGVGRPGFTWAGTHLVSAKKEWPDWTPPKEMLERQPYLPRHMEGGPNNPLGARALYLGSTLYRIHGSNEPWTIGQNVSSGCIRMRNADVEDLYERVKVGAKVVVM